MLGNNKTQKVQQSANQQVQPETKQQNDFNINVNYEQKGFLFL